MTRFRPPGKCVDIEVFDGTAYLLRSSTLEVVNVEDAGNPTPMRHLGLPFEARDMASADHLLYVAAGDAGMQIIDVADPSAPVFKGRVDMSPDTTSLGSSAGAVAADGARVFVGDDNFGLQVVDATDPDAPFVETSLLGGLGTIIGIEKNGTVLHLATDEGWFVFDVANPLEPFLMHQNAILGIERMARGGDGDILYLDTTGDDLIFDVTDPSFPLLTNTR